MAYPVRKAFPVRYLYLVFIFLLFMQRSLHVSGQMGNHQPKFRIMKLSKALLAAMLTGITLQGVQSCTKDKDEPSKEEKEKEKEKEGENKPKPYPYNCPGCGMG
jgi:hypothetical protein